MVLMLIQEQQVGVNAMLNPEGAEFIYNPCFTIEPGDFHEYYKGLASKIIDFVKKTPK